MLAKDDQAIYIFLRARTLCTGRQSLNHWTAKEVRRSYIKADEFEKKFGSLNKVQSPNTHSLFCLCQHKHMPGHQFAFF